MRSMVACVSILCAACGPVLLVGDAPTAGSAATVRDRDASVGEVTRIDAAMPIAGGEPPMVIPGQKETVSPRALLSVTPSDCGRCFNLKADGAGGVPPYQFQWDDGSRDPMRRVCVDAGAQRKVTVIVQDANAALSMPSTTQLSSEDVDAACPSTPRGLPLCVMNPSFEGTPAVNVGQNFDAAPWSTCDNDPSVNNTPDIVSDAFTMFSNAPKVFQGNTYLALGQGEQVSQSLCEDAQGGDELNFRVEVSRVDLTPGDTTKVFLEVWGGIWADCSQRKLLWASPPLTSGWTSYCVTLKPVEYMNQITLRSRTDVSTLAPEYMVVDDIVPVSECP